MNSLRERVVENDGLFAIASDADEFHGTLDGLPDVVDVLTSTRRRVFAAIAIQASGTRKEELLIAREDLNRVWVLRKVLTPLSPVEAMELLLPKMAKTKSNAEFLGAIANGKG